MASVLDVCAPFEDDYWDPSDPAAPDPSDAAPWPRTRLEEIAHLERAESRFHGAKLIEVASYVTAQVAIAQSRADADARELNLSGKEARRRAIRAVSGAERSAWAQIALKLDLSPKAAEALAAQAHAFVARCPRTLSALEAGQITRRKAEIILDQTANLGEDLRTDVEAEALGASDGRTDDQFRDKVRRLVEKADKDAVRRREEKARAARRVLIYPEGDGMWALKAVLPSAEAHAAYGILTAYAHETKKTQAPDDDRGVDALRVDGLMDILRGTAKHERITYDVRIVVPLGTVLGIGDEPGYIPGHGPIPAEVCRRIAADTAWKRLLEDPDTGNLLDLGADTYKPSVRLGEFIEHRDQTCRWPGCRRRASRCHKDHTIEFRIGGRTIRINLGALCAFHHQLKHSSGWQLVQDPDGSLTFTTPAGDVYRTRPPNLATGEARPTETVKVDGDDEVIPF